MLKNTDHCSLCDLHDTNLKRGLICSLTNDLPSFSRTCSKIQLDKIAEDKMYEVYVTKFQLKEQKKSAIFRIIFWPIIGIIVLILTRLYYIEHVEPYGILRTDMGKRGAAPFAMLSLLFCAGFTLIGKGTGPLYKFYREKNITLEKIKKTEAVLQLYGIKQPY